MTNEEVKKKIAEIALTELQVQFGCGDTVDIGDREACAESIADALIAAGIGDVSELEVKCEVLQRDVDNLTRTLEEGRKELEEANRRAEVAERALRKAVSFLSGMKLCTLGPDSRILTEKDIPEQKICEAFLSQAEEELAKEKKEC